MTKHHPHAQSGFGQELERLTEDAEDLARSLERRTSLAREEAVGAELLASRELIAQFGLAWETAAELGDLYVRQLRYLIEDNVATLGKLVDGSAQGRLAEVVGEHCERRIGHVGEGINHGIEVMSKQSESARAALQAMWAPFFAVVRQDWSQQRRNREGGAATG